jgi:23S rRNA (cytosine1962-C5)-methyltransferase
MSDPIRIHLKPREEDRILAGHPWIYDNEIARAEGELTPGCEVRVWSARGQSLGSGTASPHSKIRVRMHSRTDEPWDEAFTLRAVEAALAFRKRFRDLSSDSERIVFGEADGIPGLVADRFVGIPLDAEGKPAGSKGSWLVLQVLAAGAEARKTQIVAALLKALKPDGILERSDAPVREHEGLPLSVGILAGSVPERVEIRENGLTFAVNLEGGQKTGWFLDQRDNRVAAAAYAKGRTVLDAFCNAGGFGLCAARAGATSVLAVDASENAIAQVQDNARRNGLEKRVEAKAANAFDFLRELEKGKRRFGLVILDPPAFAKSRATLEGAMRGYKDVNFRAMRLLEPGGILVTCSCSQWFAPERFRAMLEVAAKDSGRRLRYLEERTQAPDHPIVSGYPESRYLKCVIMETVDK